VRRIERVAPWLSALQGLYYFGPGLWAVFAMQSYESAHRLRSDYWLVKAHGLFLVLIGCVLILAGLRRVLALEIKLLALGMAAGFILASVMSAIRSRLAPIYALDLIFESGFVLFWAIVLASAGSFSGEASVDGV
jgi:hypothetical protein